ncbi:MAG: transglutaminase-like domain-containing protein [Candidatus Aminicenantales bacterium]
MNRLGTRIEMVSKTLAWETEEGGLKRVRSELTMSAQTVKTEAEIGANTIVLTTESGGKPFVRSLPYDGALLGPEGIRRLSAGRLRKPGDAVGFRTFSSELSRVLDGTRTVTGTDVFPAEGKKIRAVRIREKYSDYPVESDIWLDEAGDEFKASQASPFGDMVVVRSSREEALDLGNAGGIPEEQLERTLVRSNVRLPRARSIDSLILRIRHRNPGLGWPSFAGPGQTVVEKTPGTLVLRIDRPDPATAKGKAVADPSDLGSNMYIDTGDELIRKTAAEAVGSETDVFRKAVLLKNWVSRHMTFDLGIAFAPSPEVVRNLRGTCAEYAILLATLARASGIPSRYLMGFVYLNGMWGGHAWTEMLINGTWIPMDAAVNGPGAADAARFYFSETTLDNGPGDSLTAAQRLFGNIDLDVVEYREGGKIRRIEAGTPLYKIEGDAYVNPGLGLRVRKLQGFFFAETDLIWPDKTLLAMTGPDGAVVRIFQEAMMPDRDADSWLASVLDRYVKAGKRTSIRVGAATGLKAERRGSAAVVFPDGVDCWVVQAEGKDAAGILGRALKSFVFDSK